MDHNKEQTTSAFADHFPGATNDPFIHTLNLFIQREISRNRLPNQNLGSQAIDAFLHSMKRWATPQRLDPMSAVVDKDAVIPADDILSRSLSSWIKVLGKRVDLSQFLESRGFESHMVQSSHPLTTWSVTNANPSDQASLADCSDKSNLQSHGVLKTDPKP